MSWIHESSLSWLERLAINVTKAGPIPYHIAFIMDGNRRFATKSHKHKFEGHSMGFDKLSEVLKWCLLIGVSEVTVYAFSIENFKRHPEEVETLMKLAREKFQRLLDERDKLNEKGIKINVIGNLSLLPKDIQQMIADAILFTKDNTKAVLNVAFSYTSRDEITNSIKTIVNGIEKDELSPDDVTEDLISQCMYTRNCRTPDLLVRTSGETRLSDFLLWQTSSTVIYFTEALWPEIKLYHLLIGIFLYQRSYFRTSALRNIFDSAPKSLPRDQEKINKFLENMEQKQHRHLLTLSKKVS